MGKRKNLTNEHENDSVCYAANSEERDFHQTLDENGGQDGKGSAA